MHLQISLLKKLQIVQKMYTRLTLYFVKNPGRLPLGHKNVGNFSKQMNFAIEEAVVIRL